MPERGIIALYPGTFDPVTYGHLDVISRCVGVFRHLVVAVARNPAKVPLFDVDERVEMLRAATAAVPHLEVTAYEGLTVAYARECGAEVIVRGLRAVSDFEEELKMASANRKLAAEINTVLFPPSEQYFYLSSGLVKEICRLGGPVNDFVPPAVEARLQAKFTAAEGKNNHGK